MLCNGIAQWLAARDGYERLHFATLQSERGRAVLRAAGLATEELATFVLSERGVLSTRSTAALRLARHLPFPWWFGALLLWVPAPLRDLGYRFIARRRLQWFGKKADACLMPTPALRRRLLD